MKLKTILFILLEKGIIQGLGISQWGCRYTVRSGLLLITSDFKHKDNDCGNAHVKASKQHFTNQRVMWRSCVHNLCSFTTLLMLLDSIVDINMFILDLFAKVVSTSTVCSNTILFRPDLSKPWAHQKATIWRSVAGDCCSSDKVYPVLLYR